MSGITYDAGALLAAEANRRDVWALHARALARGVQPVVPAGVLAQAWRGGPQPSLSRLLRGCRVEDLDEVQARSAGVAGARAGMADAINASVVVGAIARRDLVLTSDSNDLRKLARGLGRRIDIHPV